MRRHLEAGLRDIIEQLEAMTIPVEDRETIAQVAESVCFDTELSKVLGEIFDIMGVYGQVDIRSGRSRQITREYVSGTIYDSGSLIVSRVVPSSFAAYRGSSRWRGRGTATIKSGTVIVRSVPRFAPVLHTTPRGSRRGIGSR